MIKSYQIRLRESSFPILVLSYSVLMMHYVFTGPRAKLCLTLYPGILTVAAFVSMLMPVFNVFESMRIGEYSLRNSVSRCGIEIVYAALRNKVRVEARPLIDVIGERLRDMSAAGLLHLLLKSTGELNYRSTLFVVSGLGICLWFCSGWLLRRVEHMKALESVEKESDVPLQKLAREGALLA